MSEMKPLPSSSDSKGLSEDWTAVLVGGSVVLLAMMISLVTIPAGLNWGAEWPDDSEASLKWTSMAKPYLGKPGTWNQNPLAGLVRSDLEPSPEVTKPLPEGSDPPSAAPEPPPKIAKAVTYWPGIIGACGFLLIMGCAVSTLRQRPILDFLKGFFPLFGLAVLAYIMAGQNHIKHLNLEYALWALLLGMLISNTVGLPARWKTAVQGELYIKTGLVLLGAEVLFGKLLALGIPGIFVAWVVTPVVLISTYIFGQKILKIESRSLNMVISADMSVCGVSAAIATAAACKAKKDELSLAVGLSLSFTVLMMILMPPVILWMGLEPRVGGAWLGGTIDATGAVVAAGEMLKNGNEAQGEIARDAAVTIKMIQNILIGVTAFAVAVYWTTVVERKSKSESGVGLGEIWRRFPKFVLGFILISIGMSLLSASSYFGNLWADSVVAGVTKTMRGWLFCLAFVCIGLETNFKQLLPYFRSGKPAILYLVGQSLNLVLTLIMAYLMFGVLFKS